MQMNISQIFKINILKHAYIIIIAIINNIIIIIITCILRRRRDVGWSRTVDNIVQASPPNNSIWILHLVCHTCHTHHLTRSSFVFLLLNQT